MNYQGSLDGTSLRIAVVTARFNDFITDRLQAGALDCLKRHGVAEDAVDTVAVPGAFELPLVALTLAETGRYHAVICLGAVIRGDTTHYDYVCSEAAKGIAAAGLKTGIPVIFGVVTTENTEQAISRAGGKSGNKGWDAAMTALEMASLLPHIKA
ncbi:6,7-dimethyl-8-ribityllumazine synthase [Arenimonas sp.]|jgi:6,7-dimethyl-8-ribityllumazine synthase|uniref:6,7-dimethyl-8-ribityllumazine synthase n=1 Tax=Arenimonas sp. TaxID=1872635 RepID=UPI0037BF5567